MAIEVKITDNTGEFLSASETGVKYALEAIGEAAERHAKQNLTNFPRVDTGRLRNSVTHIVEEGEKAVYIGTNVEYAIYVEEGTSRMTAAHYLRDACTDNADEYRRLCEMILKGG